MKLTLVFALLTSGLSQAGVASLAELAYVAAAVLAWTQGRRILDRVSAHARATNATVAFAPARVAPGLSLPATAAYGSASATSEPG